MNSIRDAYIFFLEEQGLMINPVTQYKHHIINILLEKIPGIDFASGGTRPEIVFSKVTKEKINIWLSYMKVLNLEMRSFAGE